MIKQRLKKLRKLFDEHKINGYIVPTSDEYLSEYPPEYAKRLEYITGFTGSYGFAIILKNTVLFFTDGRYLTQCETQLDPDYFTIFDIAKVRDFPWKQYIAEGHIISYDPKLFTGRNLQQLDKVITQSLEVNLIDQIWTDQPDKPNSKIYVYPEKYAGRSYRDKLNECRKFIESNMAEAMVITASESVCWLLNIRAHDAPFSPLLLANCIVTGSEVFLFTDKSRLEAGLQQQRPEMIVLPESSFAGSIEEIKGTILFDSNLCSAYVSNLIKSKNYKEIKDPTQLQKACKNEVELEHMASGHVQDAVAVCEFLAMIANNDISDLSEYDLGKILTEYRAKRDGYVMDSFASICGYQDNGAVIHYKAEKDTARKIAGSGLLLIDSGGQYYGATTDITRTVSIGLAEDGHRHFYTKVLKGHIALASAIFPAGKVTGANLDVLARQYLWQEGKDYAHGTGHGVGSFLSVHEGPQSISLSSNPTLLAKGMVVSNEPGYYVPGHFGIRIENMMYVKESLLPNYLEFKMLTLVPYAKDLIDLKLLNKEELEYLKNYYREIKHRIQPHLSQIAGKWLEEEISWVL
jgi:Xaa-Pro aminopeptidase